MTTYIFDRDGVLRTVLAPEEVVDLIHDEGQYSLNAVFTGPVDVKNGEYIGFACADGRYRMFCVEESAYRDDKKTREVSATDRAVIELSESIIEEQQLLDVTIKEALRALLPAEWEIVGADPEQTEKTRAYFTSAWTMCQTLEELYGWRIIPYYTFGADGITGRRVEIEDSTPTWRGRVLRSNRDAENVCVTASGRPITRLYGIGPATNSGDVQTNLTFAAEVWTTEGGNPADKPDGQCWVEDAAAAAKYGVHAAVVSITDLTGETEAEQRADLLNKTWEQLRALNQPSIRAEANLVDLEMLPGVADVPTVRLGDLVGIRLDNGEWVEAKATAIKRNYARPWMSKITVGDKAATITSQVSGLIASATHTFERLTVYKNRFVEDEALIQLNAKYVQANADRIDLFAGELGETNVRIDGISKEVQINADKIAAQAQTIELKANRDTVGALANAISGTQDNLDEAVLRIDGVEDSITAQAETIKLKADKVTVDALETEIDGKVSIGQLNAQKARIDEIETSGIWAGDFAGVTVSASAVVAGQGDFDELSTSQVNGKSMGWKQKTVVQSIKVTTATAEVMSSLGKTMTIMYVAGVTPTYETINYLGGEE